MIKRQCIKQSLMLILALMLTAQTGMAAAADDAVIENGDDVVVEEGSQSGGGGGEGANNDSLTKLNGTVIENNIGDSAAFLFDDDEHTYADTHGDEPYVVFKAEAPVQLMGVDILPALEENGIESDVSIYEWVEGYHNEGPDNLFDMDENTKWCHASSWSYVVWGYDKAFSIDAYQFVTANDNREYPGRSPSSWILYGSDDYNPETGECTWHIIDEKKDYYDIPDENCLPVTFDLTGDIPAYQYYKLEISEIAGKETFQMSGLNLISDGKTIGGKTVTDQDRYWADCARGLKVQGSSDGKEWITLYRINEGVEPARVYSITSDMLGSAAKEYKYGYFRVIDDYENMAVAEIEFYGDTESALPEFPAADQLTAPIFSYVDAMDVIDSIYGGAWDFVYNKANMGGENRSDYLWDIVTTDPVVIIGGVFPDGKFDAPAMLDGREVIGIGHSAFKSRYDITSLAIDDNIMFVGNRAFGWCHAVAGDVKIGAEVREIAGDSLAGIDKITAYTVEEITDADLRGGHYAIYKNGCFTVGTNLLDYINSPETVEELILPEYISSIDYQAFRGADIVTLKAPGVKYVCFEGFCESNIKHIVFSDKLEYMDGNTFYFCDNLESLYVPARNLNVEGVERRDDGSWFVNGGLFRTRTYDENGDINGEITDTAKPVTVHTFTGNELDGYISFRKANNGVLKNITVDYLPFPTNDVTIGNLTGDIAELHNISEDGVLNMIDGKLDTFYETDGDPYFVFKLDEAVQFTGAKITPRTKNGLIKIKTLEATEGFGESESAKMLFDYDEETKWCSPNTNLSVVFEVSEAVAVTGYQIVTANDTEWNPGRNPNSWVLYGCNDYDPEKGDAQWSVIDSVQNDEVLEGANYTPYLYELKSAAPAYRFYKWHILENEDGQLVQVSGFNLRTADGFVENRGAADNEERDWARSLDGVKIQGSSDGKEWITLFRVNEFSEGAAEYHINADMLGSAANEYTYSYLRVIDDSDWISIAEIEFYGEANADLAPFPTSSELKAPVYSVVEADRIFGWADLGDGYYIHNELYANEDIKNPVFVIGAALPENAVVDFKSIEEYTVIGIAPYAFENETDLREIYLDGYMSYVYTRGIADCRNLEKIYVGGGLRTVEWDALIWNPSLNTVAFSNGESANDRVFIDQNCLVVDSMLVIYAGTEHVDELVLHPGVESLSSHAFAKRDIRKIICPNVRYITTDSFKESYAEEIEFGDRVEFIGINVFAFCDNLTSITIPSDDIDVEFIYEDGGEYRWNHNDTLFRKHTPEGNRNDSERRLVINTLDGTELAYYINEAKKAGQLQNVSINFIEPGDNSMASFNGAETYRDENGLGINLQNPAKIEQIVITPAGEGTGIRVLESSGGFGGWFGGEEAHNIFDYNKDTKWCCDFNWCKDNYGGAYVIFALPEAQTVTGYQIVVPQNAENERFRNPESWTLFASDDYNEEFGTGSWNEIHHVEHDDRIQDISGAEYEYGIPNPARYKYYKLVIHENEGKEVFQIADFNLIFKNETSHSFTVTEDSEFDYYYFDMSSGTNDSGRFYDGYDYIIYEFPINEGDNFAQLSWHIRNQYKVSVSITDPDDPDSFSVFHEAMPTAEELAAGMSNWGDYDTNRLSVYDLSSFCAENSANKIWVKMEDADPSNGWGGMICSDVPVVFVSGNTEGVADQYDYEDREREQETFNDIEGLKIQGSIDGETWITLFRMPNIGAFSKTEYVINLDVMSNIALDYAFTQYRVINDTRRFNVDDVKFYGYECDPAEAFPEVIEDVIYSVVGYNTIMDWGEYNFDDGAFLWDDGSPDTPSVFDYYKYDKPFSEEHAFYGQTPVMIIDAVYPNVFIEEGKPVFNGELVIPDTIDVAGSTRPVLGIAPKAFHGEDQLVSVTLGNYMRYVCDNAFEYTHGLTTVNINNSLRFVSDTAFIWNFDLQKFVRVGESLTPMQKNFAHGNFVDVYDDCLYSRNILVSVPMNKNAGQAYFFESDPAKNPIRIIGDHAMIGTKVTEVHFPDFIREIGYCALADSGSLRHVNLSTDLEYIGGDAFRYTQLEYLAVPPNVRHIDHGIVKGCDKITNITIHTAADVYINENAFYTDEDMSKQVMNIFCYAGTEAEQQLIKHNYRYGTMENQAPIYRTYEAYDGLHLEFVVHNENNVFEIPYGVNVIDSEAFRYFNEGQITAVKFPETLTRICGGAFWGKLADNAEITWSGAVPLNIEDGAFDRDFYEIIDGNELVNGIFYYYDYDTHTASAAGYWFDAIDENGRITVPAEVTIYGEVYRVISVHEWAFTHSAINERVGDYFGRNDLEFDWDKYYRDLVYVDLPDSVIFVGNDAFAHNDTIKEVKIPAGISVIQDNNIVYNAFALTAINGLDHYGTGNNRYESVDGMIIDTYADDMVICYPAQRTDATVNVPRGIVRIREDAFQNNNYITHVNLPPSIRDISGASFRGCESIEIFKFPEQNGNYRVFEDGTIRNYEGDHLVVYPLGRIPEDGILKFPNDLRSIGYAVLRGSSRVTEIIVPESVVSVHDWAFNENENLWRIMILGNLEEALNVDAMANNPSLSAVDYFGEYLELFWYENDDFAIRYAQDKYGNNRRENDRVVPGEKTTLTVLTHGEDNRECEIVVFSLPNGESWDDHDSYTYYSIDDNPFFTKVIGDQEVYRISYNANGGEYDPVTQHRVAGGTATITKEVPYDEYGREFLGWALESDPETVVYTGGEIYSEDANLALIAVWSEAYPVYHGYIDSNGANVLNYVVANGNTVFEIPYDVNIITGDAFRDVEKIDAVYFPEDLITIEGGAFSGKGEFEVYWNNAYPVDIHGGAFDFEYPNNIDGEVMYEGILYTYNNYSKTAAAVGYWYNAVNEYGKLPVAYNIRVFGEYYDVHAIADSAFSYDGLNRAEEYLRNEGKFGILELEKKAFGKLEIGNNVKVIGDWAFAGMEMCTEIGLNNQVRYIGHSVFSQWNDLLRIDRLESFTDPNATGRYRICDNQLIIDTLVFDMVVAYPAGRSETELVIPEGVKKIRMSAIENADALNTVSLPASLYEIQSHAFAGCDNITDFVIADRNENYYIASDGSIREAVEDKIVNVALGRIDENGTLALAEGFGVLKAGAVRDSERLVTLVLPESFNYFEDYAINGNNRLETIVINGSVEPNNRIHIQAFEGNESLATIEYKNSADKELHLYWNVDEQRVIRHATYTDGNHVYTENGPMLGEKVILRIEDGCNVTFTAYQGEENNVVEEYSIYDNPYFTLITGSDPVIRITYDANGGDFAPPAQHKYVGSDVKLTNETAWLDGRNFIGWAETPDGEVIYKPGDTYTGNADVTLYAVWEKGDIEFVWETDADGNRCLTYVNANGNTSFVIPSYIHIIHGNAFQDVDRIDFVSLPENLIEIHGGAFIGKGVFEVEWNSAFAIENLHDVFDDYAGDEDPRAQYDGMAFDGKFLFRYNTENGLASIFSYWNNAIDENGDIKVPSSVAADGKSYDVIDIYAGAFNYSSLTDRTAMYLEEHGILGDYDEDKVIELEAIKSISLGTVRTIGSCAFAWNTDLESISFNNNVEFINQDFVDGCENLTSVTGLDKYGTNAHRYEIADTCLIVERNFNIAYKYLRGSKWTEYAIPGGIRSIQSGAFGEADNLVRVTIPASVLEIRNGAFNGCDNIEEFLIPKDNMTYAADANGAIYAKGDYRLIIYPAGDIPEDGVVTVSDYTHIGGAFKGYEKLRELHFGNVKEIEDWGITDNPNLETITLGGGVLKSVNIDAFAYNTNLKTIYFDGSYIELYRYEWDNFPITVAKDIYGNDMWGENGAYLGEKVKFIYSNENFKYDVKTIDEEGNFIYDDNPYFDFIYEGELSSLYTVTYHTRSEYLGEYFVPVPQTKIHGKKLVLTDVEPEIWDGEFLGWTTDPEGTTVQYYPGDVYVENENLDLYPVWDESTLSVYTLTVNPNGGMIDANGGIINGKTSITLHTSYGWRAMNIEVTNPGYKFLGWSTSENGDVEYSVHDILWYEGSDMEIYAQWGEYPEYYVRLNSNAPDCMDYDGRGYNGDEIELPAMERKNYEFVGWAYRADTEEAVYLAGDSFRFLAPVVEFDFTEDIYYLENAEIAEEDGRNGVRVYGNGEGTNNTSVVETNGEFQMVDWSDGMTVSMWVKADSSDTLTGCAPLISMYLENDEYIAITSGLEAAVNANGISTKYNEYADLALNCDEWINVTVVFGNGGIAIYADGELVDTVSLIGGNYADLAESFNDMLAFHIGTWFNNDVNCGDFEGIISDVVFYNTELSEIEIKQLAAGGLYGDYSEDMYRYEIELYAVWAENFPETYTITYDANGGENAPEAQTAAVGEPVVITDAEPVREGYKFLGWSTMDYAVTPNNAYKPGAVYSAEADLTLYAVWAEIFTITYDANDGSGRVETETAYENEEYSVSEDIEFVRDGYIFLGWATESDAVEAEFNAGDRMYGYGDVTLYAVWAEEVIDPDKAVHLSVKDVTGKAGDEIAVEIMLDNNPGIAGLKFEVVFDESVMTLIDYEQGTALSEFSLTPDGEDSSPYSIVFNSTDESDAVGHLVTLIFKIADNAEEGKCNIELNIPDKNEVFDGEQKNVHALASSGKLTVSNIVYGDIDGNGSIDGVDAVLLARYVAGGYTFKVFDERAADVYHDGMINGKDLTTLRRYIVGGYYVVLGK